MWVLSRDALGIEWGGCRCRMGRLYVLDDLVVGTG